MTPKGEAGAVKAWQYGSVWLLGLWHGAWTDRFAAELGLPAGLGMGVAIPATKILEVLQQQNVVKDREEAKKDPKYLAAIENERAFRAGFAAVQQQQADAKPDNR